MACARDDRTGRPGQSASPPPAIPAVREPSGKRVHIAFTVRDRHAYCRQDDCSGAPLVTIRPANASTPLLLFPGTCERSCDTCRDEPCRPPVCTKMGVAVTVAELDWDGSYYEPGTCGAGVPCVTRRLAAEGHYVAEFCAARGARTNDSIGVPLCVDSGEHRCASVEFDYPTTSMVSSTL